MKFDKAALAAVIVTAFFMICSVQSCRDRKVHEAADSTGVRDTVYPLGFCTDSFDVEEGTVRDGEIFTYLLTRLGMDNAGAHLLTAASDSIFDPKKLRSGNRWQAYYEADTSGRGSLRYLVYNEDKTGLFVFKCTPPYRAIHTERPVSHTIKATEVTISSSLWNDMKAVGAPHLLILKLEDIYAWTVDFFALQEGDIFRVLYDESACEGELVDIDTVFYAEFAHGGKTMPAIRYDQGDGSGIYWNAEGESMRKAFLKAPLRFSRISSGFSYRRKHPVSGKVRPHTGVDYAAPAGTPVMSIGDGVVISRGWAGGGGNTVKIRHNSVYTTAYLHLSRYASGLKTGDRVSQGQVIGYVGSTGVSTGPHLDFRVWKGGSPINPLTMESPSVEPLRKENLCALDSARIASKHTLDSLLSQKRDTTSVSIQEQPE